VLALATDRGPAVPDVVGVAHQLVSGLPCLELTLGPRPGTSLRGLLGGAPLPSEGATA
jgi:hypothetical protein